MKEALTIKIEKLKNIMTPFLQKIVENVYYNQAANIKYPYIAYEFSFNKVEHSYLVDMEINIYDKSENSIAVDSIAQEIEKKLDNTYYNDEDFSFNTSLNTFNIVQEPDKTLKRIRLLFNIKLVEGGENV